MLALLTSCLTFLQASVLGGWANGTHVPFLHHPDQAIQVAVEFEDHAGEGPALFLGGDFDGVGTELTSNLVRWHGDRWSSLPETPNGPVGCMCVFDDGLGPELFVGGYFDAVGGLPVNSLAAWNGTSWRAVDPPGTFSYVDSLAVHDDETGAGPQLYATISGGVARWNGQQWSAVGNPGVPSLAQGLWSVTTPTGPRLWAFGNTPVGPDRIFEFDGATWSDLGLPPQYDALHGAAQGKAVIVCDLETQLHYGYWNGAWTQLGAFEPDAQFLSDEVNGVAKLYATTKTYAPGVVPSFSILEFASGVWTELDRLDVRRLFIPDQTPLLLAVRHTPQSTQPTFCFGGSTQELGMQGTQSLAFVVNDRVELGGHGLGITGSEDAVSLTVGSEQHVCVVGAFVTADGVRAGTAMEFDGREWTALPAVTLRYDGLEHVTASAGELWASSTDLEHPLWRWNGSEWTEPSVPIRGRVETVRSFDLGSGPELLVCGPLVVGSDTQYLTRWNGTSWTSLHADLPSIATATVFDDGSGTALFVGGSRMTFDGGAVAASMVARWNGTDWTSIAPPSQYMGVVWALQDFDDGTGAALYAAGNFDTLGGISASNIAKWNGTSWSGLGGACDGRVASLAVFDDGSGPALYATGTFTQIGGVAASHLARWNGTSWSEFAGGLHSMAGHMSFGSRLVVFDDHHGGGPSLCVFGTFQRAGDTVSCNFARWGRAVGAPSSFCDGSGDTTITPCPCNNHGARGRGCANSANALGAALGTTGSNLDDSLVLVASGLPGATTCVFLQGTERGDAPFGDGVLCLGGAIVRVALRSASAGVCTLPNASDTLTLAQMGGVQVGSGAIRRYQTYYRNGAASFCPPAAFNATNGVEVGW